MELPSYSSIVSKSEVAFSRRKINNLNYLIFVSSLFNSFTNSSIFFLVIHFKVMNLSGRLLVETVPPVLPL